MIRYALFWALVAYFILIFSLIGCTPAPQIITTTKHTVVMPEATMFECPIVTDFPKSSSLTDLQVANLIKTLYKNNMKCYNNMNSIKDVLEKAKETVDGRG